MADFCFFGLETSRVADAFDEYPAIRDSDPSLVWAIQNPTAGYCPSDATLPGDGYLANEWVQWNEAHFGATHWYVCYSPPGSGLSHSLSIHIPSAQGRARADQIAKLRMLFGHIDCAGWLQRQPFPDQADVSSAWLLLDRVGRVTAKSEAAESLLNKKDGMSLTGGRLAMRLTSAQAAFERCLSQVANFADGMGGPAALWVDRPSGRRAWLVTVRPLTVRFAGLARTTAGFHVQIREPRPRVGRKSPLTHLFDLSPREAQVLDLLARGHSLETLAHTLGISINTAKVHLHAIFEKTRTRRQAELLQLCAQIGVN